MPKRIGYRAAKKLSREGENDRRWNENPKPHHEAHEEHEGKMIPEFENKLIELFRHGDYALSGLRFTVYARKVY